MYLQLCSDLQQNGHFLAISYLMKRYSSSSSAVCEIITESNRFWSPNLKEEQRERLEFLELRSLPLSEHFQLHKSKQKCSFCLLLTDTTEHLSLNFFSTSTPQEVLAQKSINSQLERELDETSSKLKKSRKRALELVEQVNSYKELLENEKSSLRKQIAILKEDKEVIFLPWYPLTLWIGKSTVPS
jgi:hypothetical protein